MQSVNKTITFTEETISQISFLSLHLQSTMVAMYSNTSFVNTGDRHNQGGYILFLGDKKLFWSNFLVIHHTQEIYKFHNCLNRWDWCCLFHSLSSGGIVNYTTLNTYRHVNIKKPYVHFTIKNIFDWKWM